jgi:hypothetical protein
VRLPFVIFLESVEQASAQNANNKMMLTQAADFLPFADLFARPGKKICKRSNVPLTIIHQLRDHS